MFFFFYEKTVRRLRLYQTIRIQIYKTKQTTNSIIEHNVFYVIQILFKVETHKDE